MINYDKYKVPEWKLTFIRLNCEEMTVPEMEKAIQVSDCKIRAYLKEQGLKAKPSTWFKKNRPPGMKVKGHAYVPRYPLEEKPKVERPPAVYSNANVLERYGYAML